MPKRKVKYTKRNPQPTTPAEKPKKSPVKTKPKKDQTKKPGNVSKALVKLAESKHGKFVPYYILAFVVVFIGIFVYLAFKPASANLDTTFNPDLQLSEPAGGDEVAIMQTSMGDIAMRFFEEEAPKAVENFKTLAKNGYYDGLTFHRVINDFMIQSGDPTGTGSGGESAFGENFEDEFSPSLLNIRGAVSMANAGPNTNSSQFFINQKQTADTESLNVDTIPEEVKQAYEKNGGNPLLDGYYSLGEGDNSGHTVFAQVLSGMDVVDRIAAVQTGDADKPLEDVIIKGISFMTFNDYLAAIQSGAFSEGSNSSDASSADADENTASADASDAAVASDAVASNNKDEEDASSTAADADTEPDTSEGDSETE